MEKLLALSGYCAVLKIVLKKQNQTKKPQQQNSISQGNCWPMLFQRHFYNDYEKVGPRVKKKSKKKKKELPLWENFHYVLGVSLKLQFTDLWWTAELQT